MQLPWLRDKSSCPRCQSSWLRTTQRASYDPGHAASAKDQPPSTIKFRPVTARDHGDAKNRAASAISSGVVTLPSGVAAAIRSNTASGVAALASVVRSIPPDTMLNVTPKWQHCSQKTGTKPRQVQYAIIAAETMRVFKERLASLLLGMLRRMVFGADCKIGPEKTAVSAADHPCATSSRATYFTLM